MKMTKHIDKREVLPKGYEIRKVFHSGSGLWQTQAHNTELGYKIQSGDIFHTVHDTAIDLALDRCYDDLLHNTAPF